MRRERIQVPEHEHGGIRIVELGVLHVMSKVLGLRLTLCTQARAGMA